MRKQAILLVVVLLSLTSCGDSWFGDTNSRPGQAETLTGILTGKWQIVAARAGDEDITNLYQGYVIEFTKDGGYTIVNPLGAPNPNRNNESGFGFWTGNTSNSITLDQTVLMQILGALSRERIQFQWDVTVLGKGTVTYHWDIIPA